MQSEDRMAILRYVEEEYAGFVILDTLARHIPGGDENTGPVMSAVVETMEAIKRETEGCVMVVHHTGWSDGERLRGHSSLEGALDHAFAVLPHSPNSQDGRIKIRAQKHKNHPDHYTLLNLQLTEVAGAVALEEDTTLSDSERETLEALVSRLRETNGSAPLGLKSHEWEEVAPVARATFYRCKARLLSLGEVQHKDGYWSCLT
jgi:RecA-family ATPase